MTDEFARVLQDALPAEPDRLARLGERLAAAARVEGVLDVAVRTVDTPVGPLLLATTDRGLVRVAYDVEDHDAVLQHLAQRISPRILRSRTPLDEAARQIEDYFTGKRHRFELALDWRLTTAFRGAVLQRLAQIEYGRTATYAAVAQLAGSPRAVRAVASACAANPLPVVVPCHRVVRSDGDIGGYLGGPDAKRLLLAHEGGVRVGGA